MHVGVTPQLEHRQLGLVVPSLQRMLPFDAQTVLIPPWLEQQPGQASGVTTVPGVAPDGSVPTITACQSMGPAAGLGAACTPSNAVVSQSRPAATIVLPQRAWCFIPVPLKISPPI